MKRGRGSDALGDQWKGAQGLVKKWLNRAGPWRCTPAGAPGNPLSGKPGVPACRYDAGGLGAIEFAVNRKDSGAFPLLKGETPRTITVYLFIFRTWSTI